MKKLIDYFAEKENPSKCPYCIIGSSGDGIGGYWCKLKSGGNGPFLLTFPGAEFCTMDDWARCPFNKERSADA